MRLVLEQQHQVFWEPGCQRTSSDRKSKSKAFELCLEDGLYIKGWRGMRIKGIAAKDSHEQRPWEEMRGHCEPSERRREGGSRECGLQRQGCGEAPQRGWNKPSGRGKEGELVLASVGLPHQLADLPPSHQEPSVLRLPPFTRAGLTRKCRRSYLDHRALPRTGFGGGDISRHRQLLT